MARDRGRHRGRDDRDDRDHGDDLRTQILDMLLDRVREDPYPSSTMLDMIEAMLHDDEKEQYTSVLMDKVSRATFPSMDQLRRLEALA